MRLNHCEIPTVEDVDSQFVRLVPMIDKLQRVSQAIQVLRLPAIAVGLICLAMTIFILLGPRSDGEERFLIPSFVGVLWSVSTYTFIVTFRSVPKKADDSQSLAGKLLRRVQRGWYWAISIAFVGATMATIYFTNSVISIWVRSFSE